MNILHKYFDKIQVSFDKNVVPTNCNYLDKLVKTDYLQFLACWTSTIKGESDNLEIILTESSSTTQKP